MDSLADKYGLDDLTTAVAGRNLEKVMEIINSVGLSHNPLWINGYAPLCLAIKNASYRNSEYVEKGYLAIVHILLDYNAQVNYEHEKGNTPLHWAVIASKCEVVRELLKRKADLNKRNHCLKNAFDLAIEYEKIEVLGELLAYVSEDSISSETYFKLLFDLINKNYDAFAEMLLAKCQNFDINETNGDFNFLSMAVTRRLDGIVESLLGRGADIDYIDKTRDGSKTALLHACDIGDFEMVKLLLDYGASLDVNQISFTIYYFGNYYPLHQAIVRGHYNIVKELLDRGDDVNRKYNQYSLFNGIEEKSALHLACRKGLTEIVKLLLERNADLHIKDNRGEMPINNAITSYESGTFTYLIENENLKLDFINATSIIKYAVINNKNKILNEAFKYLEKLNSREYLRYKVELEMFHSDSSSRPILHNAARDNLNSAIDGLVENGALVDFKNPKGRSPIHIAFRYKKLQSIKSLLKNGADIFTLCNKGYTPFDYMNNEQVQETRYDTDEEERDYDEVSYTVRRLEDDNQSIIDYFIQHVIKLKCLNLHVNENDYQTAINLTEDPFKNREKYIKEVKKMKKRLIYNNINFYKVVTANLNELVVYLNNPIIFNRLKSEDNYNSMFPHYSIIISSAFQRGLARKKLLDELFKYTIFDMIRKLPYPCKQALLDCFSNLDLKKVIYQYKLNR